MERIIFHIDVNSAYLSWEAVHRIENGSEIDLRDIPSVVGGDPKTRRGIVLAKSLPAKKYGIQTGETLHKAFQKCPNLTSVSPSYQLYMKCSNSMKELLEEYSPDLQRFSVDEFFVEFTSHPNIHREYKTLAYEIKERIKNELGFTVNIGISTNKLLAKIASDFKKPDNIHTLFKHEIEEKLWVLPVDDLYMVGRATAPKLHLLGIHTVGDLANADENLIRYKLKSHGVMIQEFARGIESSAIRGDDHSSIKGIGNSTTIKFDVDQKSDAYMVLLSLTEMVCMRLRDEGFLTSLVSVSIKSSDLSRYSHQRRLFNYTDNTKEIFEIVKLLFDESWNNEAIRHLGVRVSGFKPKEFYQYSIFDSKFIDKNRKLDETVDELRIKYGNKSLFRGCFLHSGFKPISGGVIEEDYPVMTSIL